MQGLNKTQRAKAFQYLKIRKELSQDEWVVIAKNHLDIGEDRMYQWIVRNLIKAI